MTAIEEYVAGLGLDAYLVGGAVRDELLGLESKDADFLVLGVDHAGLRAALAPHGRVADLEVAGQLVGVRLFPRDRTIRELAPAGIEFAPPRAERSTGPGRHDFEIVAGADISVEDDMRRRDFTVNAIAKRLATGELVDPLGGAPDLERRILRTVSPQSFAEDPLRLVRGLRFVSQLDLDPADETLAQMRVEAASVRLVSAERIGGGLRRGRPRRAVAAPARRAPAEGAPARPRHRRPRRAPAGVRGRDRLRPVEQASAPDARRAHLRGRPGRRRPGRVARRAARGAPPRPRQAARGGPARQAGSRARGPDPAPPALPDRAASPRGRDRHLALVPPRVRRAGRRAPLPAPSRRRAAPSTSSRTGSRISPASARIRRTASAPSASAASSSPHATSRTGSISSPSTAAT